MARKKKSKRKSAEHSSKRAGDHEEEIRVEEAPAASLTEREARIVEHTAYLEALIAMIPPKYYFAPDPEEMGKRFQKHVGNKPQTPKHQRKLEANERRKERLDPAKQITVPEQQQQIKEQEEAELELHGTQSQFNDATAPTVPTMASGSLMSSESLSVAELKDRLAQRLVQLRASRGGTSVGREPAASKAPQTKHKARKASGEGASSRKNHGGASNEAGGGQTDAVDVAAQASSSLTFSKLETKGTNGQPKPRKRKRLQELLQAADSKQRLQHATRAEGTNEDAQIDAWEKAFEKAGGIKQVDDPKLLRKTLKRQQRQKKKSSQEWKQRIKSQLKTQTEKQEKRKANLAARQTKGKVRAAHRAARAGFEGKKKGFLN